MSGENCETVTKKGQAKLDKLIQIVSFPESKVVSGKLAKELGLCHKCIPMSQWYE